VIVVAAGRGARVGAAVPKQLLPLGDQTILQRSVAAFDRHPAIADIVVVLPPELTGDGPVLSGVTARPCRYAAGGQRRQDSVAQGFAAIAPETDVVLVHDAARPFVSEALITRVIDAASQHGAAVPAVVSRDTVKRMDRATRVVRETIPRDEIWLAQTPQAFRRDVLAAAIAAGAADATDEASLVERSGHAVAVVMGSQRNIKITAPGDLELAEFYLKR